MYFLVVETFIHKQIHSRQHYYDKSKRQELHDGTVSHLCFGITMSIHFFITDHNSHD